MDRKPRKRGSHRPVSSEVGAFEAKTKLGQLLDQVERGDTVVITRHGERIAMLVPYEERVDRRRIGEVVDLLLNYRSGARLPAGVTIKDLISEGRR